MSNSDIYLAEPEEVKPCDTVASVILDNITIYNRIKKSIEPLDVLQCIKLAQNISNMGDQLMKEALERRAALIRQLQGDVP